MKGLPHTAALFALQKEHVDRRRLGAADVGQLLTGHLALIDERPTHYTGEHNAQQLSIKMIKPIR